MCVCVYIYMCVCVCVCEFYFVVNLWRSHETRRYTYQFFNKINRRTLLIYSFFMKQQLDIYLKTIAYIHI